MVADLHTMTRLAFFVAAAALTSAAHSAEWKMFDRRLGMFVHWGIYSVGGWHEQEQMRKGMDRAEYEKCAGRFTAEKFDADALVGAADSAGAEYIVFTSKHHDGFCMWDTATTDYKVTNTPARRDILAELAAACRRRGMKLGLYYSNPDWHHPNAHNDRSSHQIPLQDGDRPDMERYIAYVKAQVTELLSNYGEIVCFFWDIPTKVDRPEMDELVRRLQPGIMVNNRGWGNKATSDYSTPERSRAAGGDGRRHVEACDSVGAQSWGYRANEDYRTLRYLTGSIDGFLAGGGNFLLNVGPKPDGTLPAEATALLAKVGAWHAKVRESFKGVETVTNLVADSSCIVTRRGGDMYLHYPDGLSATGVDLAPMDAPPASATLLNTGEPVAFSIDMMPRNYWPGGLCRPTLHLRGLPADALTGEAVVIKLSGCAADLGK